MKVAKFKLHNKVANKSQKNKTFRMVEDGDNLVPRDPAFPLDSDIFVFNTTNASEVKP